MPILVILLVSNKIFRQIIGIPMWADPAPCIANLFLYLYENRFLNKLKKEDLWRARKLRHVFRFIDDLITLNDDDEFLRSYLDIYPKEMELKVKHQNTQKASHLEFLAVVSSYIGGSVRRSVHPFVGPSVKQCQKLE